MEGFRLLETSVAELYSVSNLEDKLADTVAGPSPLEMQAPDPVVALFRSALQLPDDIRLEDSTQLSAIDGWDSFGHVRLVIEVETLIDRRLEMDEIVAINSVGDVRVLLNGKGQAHLPVR